MRLSEFHYELPRELIAQKPLKERDKARLMVIDRASGGVAEKVFTDIKEYIRPGDCLVLNDTRVIPARFYGQRKTGGKVEIFLLDTDSESPRALVRPSKKIKEGEDVVLENGIKATVLGQADAGRFVSFDAPLEEVLAKEGHVPLPPYIDREDSLEDREDYQTVYARTSGATASPTAGLHFTEKLLNELESSGVAIARVTLHTSYGTFAPVKEDNIEDHLMHEEYFEIDETAAEIINSTKSSGGRVFAVGTTSTRVLETAGAKNEEMQPSKGYTNLFIYPGYEFKIINSIITNFHLPESTLLMLVSAFAGRELIFEAYKKAVEERFRFFSYGDAMLIT